MVSGKGPPLRVRDACDGARRLSSSRYSWALSASLKGTRRIERMCMSATTR